MRRRSGRSRCRRPSCPRRLGESFPPTPEQAEAIQAPLRPHLVVAGAGSGKTQTMGLRVVWLVANGLVEPHRVLGLTFTRKAAAELGERVRRMLQRLAAGPRRVDPFLTDDVAASLRTGEPIVTTYHSYAAGLVGEHALRIGLEPDTRLVGEAMSWQYAAQVVESYDGDMDAVGYARRHDVIGDVLALAGEMSEHLRDPAEVVDADRAGPRAPRGPAARRRAADQAGTTRSADLLDALPRRAARPAAAGRALHRATSGRAGAMDYGDQVAVAARIAREHPEVAEIERGRFAAVLLDEYQDTGEAQRVLLTSLFGRGHPVTAVGDPRQSIYGWRGASAGNLERFGCGLRRRPAGGAERADRELPQRRGRSSASANVDGRRHPRARLGLADAPLTPGPGREGAGESSSRCTRPSPTRRRGSPSGWLPSATRVAAGSRGVRSPSWPGGGRTSRGWTTELRARGVPCEVVGLGGLLARPEVVDVVSTLRVLADPAAGGALVRLLDRPALAAGPARPRRAGPAGPADRGHPWSRVTTADIPGATPRRRATLRRYAPPRSCRCRCRCRLRRAGLRLGRRAQPGRRARRPGPAVGLLRRGTPAARRCCATSCAGCAAGRPRRCPTW